MLMITILMVINDNDEWNIANKSNLLVSTNIIVIIYLIYNADDIGAYP